VIFKKKLLREGDNITNDLDTPGVKNYYSLFILSASFEKENSLRPSQKDLFSIGIFLEGPITYAVF
jgi:hypothetical protein